MNRFTTKGILNALPFGSQKVLWDLYDSMTVPEKDYFQVFELSKAEEEGKPLQKIRHFQEEPFFEEFCSVPTSKAINEKVYIINDFTHETMLLASEY